MDANAQWFKVLDKVVGRWYDRVTDQVIRVGFDGYKCSNYFEGCEALAKAGAFQLTADYDTVCGKTFCTFREPRAALACRKD